MAAHQIEPELLGRLPRRVRERPWIVALQLWLTRGAVVLLCFACYLASQSLQDAHAWLRYQQKTIGVVLAKSIHHGKTDEYQVTFSYDISPNRRNEAFAYVGSDFYESVYENGPLSIYYRDQQPGQWRLSPTTSSDIREMETNWYLGIAIGAAVMMAGLAGLKSYRDSRLRLLREGHAAIASVTKRTLTTGSKGEQYRHLTYKWMDSRSREHSHQIQVSESTYDKYPESAQFTVLCPADNRLSSFPYFLITEAVVEG